MLCSVVHEAVRGRVVRFCVPYVRSSTGRFTRLTSHLRDAQKNKNSVASGDVTMMDAKGTTPHPLNAKYEHLTISILTENPHVVVVLLNRPRKRNAINAKVRHVVGAAGDDATSF